MSKAATQLNPPQLPTADELEAVLREHVLDAWFPRCVDEEYGGFLCNFDRAWRPRGTQEKLLEFQARQTLLAAEACQAYPHDQRLRRAALHGFRYLRDVLWDSDSGGWFHSLDRAGTPLYAQTKHVHGAAYAIEACVAVHEALAEPGALDLARRGFDWLEDFAYDRQHGGYFGFLKRDGSVVRQPSQCPWPAENDVLGTPIGLKDSNVHSDLVETFSYLGRASRDSKVKERLTELTDVFCDKVLFHFYYEADFTPVPHAVRFGYSCQNAFRLLLASRVIGDETRIQATAMKAADHTLRYGWDRRHGGIYYAGPGASPTRLHGQNLIVRCKSWWVQLEALKSLMAVSQLAPDNANYQSHLALQWNYIRKNLIDRRHGGIFAESVDGLAEWRRWLGTGLAPAHVVRKGDIWKDGSHDGRALMYCIACLRKKTKVPAGEKLKYAPVRELGLVA